MITLTVVVAVVVPVLLAITLHEVAHGWAARAHGDYTATHAGRLTLNPLRHMELFGTVLVPVCSYAVIGIAIGWAKPMPVDYQRLTPQQGAQVAMAGPACNMAMALWWLSVAMLAQEFGLQWIEQMARVGMLFNVVFAIGNMLPVPPLDGWRVLQCTRAAMVHRTRARVPPEASVGAGNSNPGIRAYLGWRNRLPFLRHGRG